MLAGPLVLSANTPVLTLLLSHGRAPRAGDTGDTLTVSFWFFFPYKGTSPIGFGAIPLVYDLIVKNATAIFFPNMVISPLGIQTSAFLLEGHTDPQQTCQTRLRKSSSEALTQCLKEPKQRCFTWVTEWVKHRPPSDPWHWEPCVCCWDSQQTQCLQVFWDTNAGTILYPFLPPESLTTSRVRQRSF